MEHRPIFDPARAVRLAALSLGSLLASTAAFPAEWSRTAGVSVGSYYTDNVCLAPTGRQGKVVGTVTPNIALRGDGGRARMGLRAAVEYNTLGDSDLRCQNQGFGGFLRNREPWVPRADFLGSVDAIGDWLVLESTARAAQNPINPFAAGGDENLNALGNTNITYQWSAGARIQKQYADNWSYLLRYNYSEQYNTANVGLGDNQQDLVVLDAGMLPTYGRLTFRVGGTYQEVNFEERGALPAFSNRLSRVELRALFRINDSWSADARVGEEDNLFLSAPNNEIDGTFWDAGLRWQPNERISIGAGYGERFFGSTPRFDISYRHKRSSLSASYVRDLQFPRNLRGGRGDFDAGDPFAPDPGGVPGDGLGSPPGAPTFIGNQPVLNDRFTLLYRFTARRTSFTLTLNDSQQTRVADNREGGFRSALASVQRRMSSSISTFIRVQWQDNQALGGVPLPGIEPRQGLERYQVTVGVRRRLTDHSRIALQYRYRDQMGQQEANSFIERRIGATFSYTF